MQVLIKSENTILLTFKNKETAEHVRLVSRRKGISLESYILDNFEWDDQIPCIESDRSMVCHSCDYRSTCPDVVA